MLNWIYDNYIILGLIVLVLLPVILIPFSILYDKIEEWYKRRKHNVDR